MLFLRSSRELYFRVALSLLLAALMPSVLRAAVILRGRVIDSVQAPVVGAQVQLFDVGKGIPFDFLSTDSRGGFRFRVPRLRVVRLEVRALGREDFMQEIDLTRASGEEMNLGDILLHSRFEEIREVHVEAEKSVSRRGDTVAFRVGAFAQGGEKSIEEIIKKMPGMKVEEDGKIRYLGREVEKVMVGGADMFGRNYQLLTKNLDPTAVHEVQVLEHFEENRLLRRHRQSERVVMNLALARGRGQLIGTLRAGYGYRNVHDAQLSLVGVFNALQFNVLANSNQVGVSPAASAAAWQAPQGLRGISGGDIARVGVRDVAMRLSPIVGMQGAQAPLNDARRRQNMSHMLSVGMVYTPSSKFRMNVSGVGQFERDLYASELISDWEFNGQSLYRHESSRRLLRTYLGGGRVTLEGQAGENADVRYDGGYSLIGDRGTSVGEHAAGELREVLAARWQRMDHTVLYTHSFDSLGLLRGGVEWQSQWIDPRYEARTVGGVPLGLATNEGIAACYNQISHFARSNWVYIAPTYRGLTGDARLGVSYDYRRLRASDLWTSDAAYDLKTYNAYAGGSISYTYGAFKALALVLGHAVNATFFDDRGTNAFKRWVYYPEQQLTLQLSKSAHLMVVTYGYNASYSTLLGLLPRAVLTSFRGSYEGEPLFRVYYGHSALAFYSYGMPTSRLTAEVALLYNFNPRPSVLRNVVTANRSFSYVMVGKRNDMLDLSVKGDLFIPSLMTNVRVEMQGTQGRYAQYVNGASLDVRSRKAFASLVTRTRVRSVLDVQLGASWSMLRLDAQGMRFTHHDMSQFIETQLHVGPARVGISVDRVEVGIERTHPNAIYLLDAEVEVDVIQSRLTFYVEGRNLMNSRYYSQKSGSNIETLSMRYEIPALRVIGGVRWQF